MQHSIMAQFLSIIGSVLLLRAILSSRDIFVSMPMRYGKSVIYTALPLSAIAYWTEEQNR